MFPWQCVSECVFFCSVLCFQWLPVWLTAAYRLVLGAYCLGLIVYSGFHPANGETKWFVYFTNWSYSFLTLYFLVAGATSAQHFRRKRVEDTSFAAIRMREDRESRDLEENAPNEPETEGTGLAWYHKLQWLLFNVAAPNAFLLSGVYWNLLYTGQADLLDISTHALNSVFTLIETCLGSVPVRVLHVIYPMTYAILYLLMTVVYWACGGTNAADQPFVYSILDYGGSPGLAAGLSVLYVLIAVPLFHLMLFGFYKLRQKVLPNWCIQFFAFFLSCFLFVSAQLFWIFVTPPPVASRIKAHVCTVALVIIVALYNTCRTL